MAIRTYGARLHMDTDYISRRASYKHVYMGVCNRLLIVCRKTLAALDVMHAQPQFCTSFETNAQFDIMQITAYYILRIPFASCAPTARPTQA
jgi:hypothetical protein